MVFRITSETAVEEEGRAVEMALKVLTAIRVADPQRLSGLVSDDRAGDVPGGGHAEPLS